jgi:hypothetical protein
MSTHNSKSDDELKKAFLNALGTTVSRTAYLGSAMESKHSIDSPLSSLPRTRFESHQSLKGTKRRIRVRRNEKKPRWKRNGQAGGDVC